MKFIALPFLYEYKQGYLFTLNHDVIFDSSNIQDQKYFETSNLSIALFELIANVCYMTMYGFSRLVKYLGH